ncbi:MAG: DUF2812 domain-containing protein [Solobacterium sp.]|nr:DUF2812 domain-containing protein [Solobacterium sp.]
MSKLYARIFTIADYEEEEDWLRQQNQNGLKIVKFTAPCFYTFEECEPQDVIYRLDYREDADTDEYRRMASDFGWEYFGQFLGWLYFRKPAADADVNGEDELFSDNASRAEMAESILRTRFVPVALIFFVCVLPNLYNAVSGRMGLLSGFFGAFFGIMLGIYIYLIIHCGRKLKEIRDRYRN